MAAELEAPSCYSRRCKHFKGVREVIAGDETSEVPVCTAFPDGIPEAIAYGPVLHDEPYPGDRGIRYERGEFVLDE